MELGSGHTADTVELISGKVVFVTGGAGFLGQAFCRAIAQNGGVPIVADIDADRGEAVSSELRLVQGCNEATFIQIDITDPESVQSAFKIVKQRFGRID